MSEVENNEEVAVAETEVEQQGVNVEDLVNAISQQNFNRAKDHFDSILGDKVNDAVDAERIAVADSIFNDAPEEEQLELDLDDEVEVEDDIVIDDELEDEVEVEDEVVIDEIEDEDEN